MGGPTELTADDVHNVAFSKPPMGRRGYHEDQVDAFLDVIERRLADPVNVRRPSAAEVQDVAFSKPPIGKRGYDEDQVDAFLAAVVRHLEKVDGALPVRHDPPLSTQAYEAPSLDAPRRKWWQFR